MIKTLYQIKTLPSLCTSLEICPTQLCDMLKQCCISMCLQLYQFWLVGQRCRCQPHSSSSDCDCACLIIYQSLCCEMNAGQTRGGSAQRSLCSEWLSWTSFKKGTLFFFSTSFWSLPFSLFWIPFTFSPCPLLPFLSADYHISLHSFSPLFFPFFSSLCVPPIPFLFLSFLHPFRPLNPCHVGLKTFDRRL